jgi:hypothetical protein
MPKRKKKPELNHEEVIDKVIETQSINKTADFFGVSRQAIQYHLDLDDLRPNINSESKPYKRVLVDNSK